MVPPASHRVPRVLRYSGYGLSVFTFDYVALTLFRRPSHAVRLVTSDHDVRPQPQRYCYLWFGLLRVRSPLLAESLLMSFPRPTSMFQFRRFPTYCYLIHSTLLEVCSSGLPHSEISGSMLICSSPKLIAAYHVLHRLLMPRHSPCALISLT